MAFLEKGPKIWKLADRHPLRMELLTTCTQLCFNFARADIKEKIITTRSLFLFRARGELGRPNQDQWRHLPFDI